jgi:hypothetical protein
MVSTTFDTLVQLHATYNAEAITATVKALEDLGVEVRHGVDATQLGKTFGRTADDEIASRKAAAAGCHSDQVETFDVIHFNFPHWGGRGHIERNRQLLQRIFLSVAPFLADDDRNGTSNDYIIRGSSSSCGSEGVAAVSNGSPLLLPSEVRISLVKGQGGTPMDQDLGAAANTWRVVESAHGAGLVLAAVEPFAPPEGYRCVGRRGRDASFWLGGSLTHVFVKGSGSSPRSHGVESLFPPLYSFDLSFWVVDEEACDEAEVVRIVRRTVVVSKVPVDLMPCCSVNTEDDLGESFSTGHDDGGGCGGSGDGAGSGGGREEESGPVDDKDIGGRLDNQRWCSCEVESAEIVARSRAVPRDERVSTTELPSLVLRVVYRPRLQTSSLSPSPPSHGSTKRAFLPPMALSRQQVMVVHERVRMALATSYPPILMRTAACRPKKGEDNGVLLSRP